MSDFIFIALIVIIKLIIYEQLKVASGNHWMNALKYLGFNLVAFTILWMIGIVLYLPILILCATIDSPTDLFSLVIRLYVGMAFIVYDMVYFRKTAWIRNYNRYILIILVNLVVGSFVSAATYFGINYLY